MKRLVDGAFSLITNPPFPSEVCMLDDQRSVTVPDEQVQELMVLSQGAADDADTGPLFATLQRHGLADDGLPAVDARALRQLQEIGHGYRWRLRDVKGAERLVALLQRAHSQRKGTYLYYGQTPVLPECGVRRCVELTRRLGSRQRVLLIGDDDLLCLPLARMGHHVTVLEIDPLLVEFLQRVAAQEKLKIAFHSQDVRQPVPAAWVGAFDAVMTDPMSYEPCLMAFLVRGVSALRTGGHLYTCLHPYARDVFHGVGNRLPVGVVDHLAAFNAYHFEGFQESWYRSDLVVLERLAGAEPYAWDQVLPFPDLIEGAHAGRWHAATRLRPAPFKRPRAELIPQVLRVWAQRAHRTILDVVVTASETHHHVYVALADGGHVALSVDVRRGSMTYAMYPYRMPWDALLSTMLAETFGMMSPAVVRCEVPPLDAPTIVVGRTVG